MSLYSDLVEVLTPYANKIKGLTTDVGNLSDLDTEDKSNLVAAINEAAQSGGTEIIIDNTLTQSGQAADAKATGDAISQLSADLDDNVNDLKSAFNTTDIRTYILLAHPNSTTYRQIDLKSGIVLKVTNNTSGAINITTHTGTPGTTIETFGSLAAGNSAEYTLSADASYLRVFANSSAIEGEPVKVVYDAIGWFEVVSDVSSLEANVDDLEVYVPIVEELDSKAKSYDTVFLHDNDVVGAMIQSIGKPIIQLSCDKDCNILMVGRNLLAFPYYQMSRTQNGITYTANADGTIKINGTSTGNATMNLEYQNAVVKKGKYTISGIPKGVYFLKGDSVVCGLDDTFAEFEIDEEATNITFKMQIPSGKSFSNVICSPMLEYGSEATKIYEKYKSTALAVTAGTQYSVDTDGTYTNIFGDVNDAIVTASVSMYDFVPIKAINNYVLSGKVGVCFGDSLTEGVGSLYSAYLHKEMGIKYTDVIEEMTGAKIINCGFGGARMSSTGDYSSVSFPSVVNAKINSSYSVIETMIEGETGTSHIDRLTADLNNLKNVDMTKVNFVCIAFGTNDWNGNVPIDNPSNKFDTSTFCGGFRKGLQDLMTAYPQLKVFVFTPSMRFKVESSDGSYTFTSSDEWTNSDGKYLSEYCDALIEASNTYGHCQVKNEYNEAGINYMNRPLYYTSWSGEPDGTHRNDAGYQLLGEHYARFILSHY